MSETPITTDVGAAAEELRYLRARQDLLENVVGAARRIENMNGLDWLRQELAALDEFDRTDNGPTHND